MKKVPESITDIQELLKDSYTAERYEHLRRLQKELLGFASDSTEQIGHVSTSGTFHWYPPLVQTKAEYQKPNRTLNNLRILTSQTRSSEIVPKWVGLTNEDIELARDAWMQQRSQGLDGYGGWKDDHDRAFMDFAGLGTACLRVRVREDGDYACVGPVWRNPLHVGFDPFVADPNESKWFWDADIWSIEQAEERFPDFDFDASAEQYLTHDGVMAKGVVIIEYFASYPEKGYPGYIAFLKDFDGDVIEWGDNPFEKGSHHIINNFTPPGAKYPVGLIQMQSYAVKRIDEIDNQVKTYADRGTQLVVDHELLNAEDWKKIQSGQHPQYVAFGDAWNESARASGRQPFLIVPRDQVPADLWQERQFWEQYLRESSGVSSSMAGVVNTENRTATEVNQVAQQTAAQTAFLSREWARAMQSFYPKIGHAAKMYDTAPFYVTYGNITVAFNEDGDNQTTSKVVWDGILQAVIGEEDLIKTDVNLKRQQEMMKHLQTYQLNQNPETFKEYLKAAGYKNPDEHMPAPPPQMAPPGLGAENSPNAQMMG